ncbi:hypothetical protein J2Y38_002805 [Flavobacterium sp. 2755]|uniref:T9SS type A sorting domain-containing protein n=1 Tax=Flavobacterium sp. 2755 TaxID=2817765 RepID=UPI00285FF3A8|nr:T9SS type A sorting domain-containing protein [Flavobacterium sp. 2755]MDR6762594.1 hypothetical protein [Flavobacterium sp. 2755]
MKKKILIMALLFFVKFGFGQNTVSYSSLNTTLTLNSGVEGTSDIIVNCSGSSGTPVVLNTFFLCGNPDGYISYVATNGHSLTPGQTTTLKFKFKKTVTTDTQIIYKFSTNGSCFQDESKMIKVTVNYKASTTPTNPPVSTSTIYWQSNRFFYVGEYDKVYMGGDGAPDVTYEWEKLREANVWVKIPGKTSSSIMFSDLELGRTYFRRILKNTSSGNIYYSNELMLLIVPLVSNNTITLTGSIIEGSSPEGGMYNYTYKWYAYVVEGEDPWLIGESQSCTVPANVYNFMQTVGINKVPIVREVKSEYRTFYSNFVNLARPVDITNNNINLVGSNILGSLPNGGIGVFDYEYYLYQEFEGEIIGEPALVGKNQNLPLANYGGLTTKIYRKIISGNKTSISNTIIINPSASFAKTTSTSAKTSTDLTAYPNPASESINFSTNFTTDKEIEIVLYSENLGNEKSVFKGKVTPNQVVNWNIPSSYQKGIYFYKILSDNKEVKTGKVIFK